MVIVPIRPMMLALELAATLILQTGCQLGDTVGLWNNFFSGGYLKIREEKISNKVSVEIPKKKRTDGYKERLGKGCPDT